MQQALSQAEIIIFDTTMRDGELMPGVKMNIEQKIVIAQLLEEMQVDIIEVGYPGAFAKDFTEIVTIAKLIKNSTICGLAGMKNEEILSLAEAIKPATRGRIHIYTPVNLKDRSNLNNQQVLESIEEKISLARNYCNDVEWSALDAARSQPDFLCKAVETAIESGANTVSIPDTFGTLLPEEFCHLITTIVNRVPNIDRATISVHCHDDLGLAVVNSIAALKCGARQIECAINGLGARKGNADLAKVAIEISQHSDYRTKIKTALLDRVSEFVSGMKDEG